MCFVVAKLHKIYENGLIRTDITYHQSEILLTKIDIFSHI